MKRTIIALAIALLTSATANAGTHYYNATDDNVLAGVPHCSEGAMTLNDNGWLTGDDGAKVDYHAIMAHDRIHGVPDALYATMRDGQSIRVCQAGYQLRYSLR